jgi:hypothetical protein
MLLVLKEAYAVSAHRPYSGGRWSKGHLESFRLSLQQRKAERFHEPINGLVRCLPGLEDVPSSAGCLSNRPLLFCFSWLRRSSTKGRGRGGSCHSWQAEHEQATTTTVGEVDMYITPNPYIYVGVSSSSYGSLLEMTRLTSRVQVLRRKARVLDGTGQLVVLVARTSH